MYFQFHLKRGDILQGLAYNKKRLEVTVIAILCCINKTDIWQTFRDHLDHIAAPCSTGTVANRESACLLQWKRQTKRSKFWSHYIKIVFWIVITMNSTNFKQVFQMHSYGIQTSTLKWSYLFANYFLKIILEYNIKKTKLFLCVFVLLNAGFFLFYTIIPYMLQSELTEGIITSQWVWEE